MVLDTWCLLNCFIEKLKLFGTIKSWELKVLTLRSHFIMIFKAFTTGKDSAILSNGQNNSSWADL